MKKQVLIETLSVVTAFAGIVYGVFAASYLVGIVAAIALGIILVVAIAPSLTISRVSDAYRDKVANFWKQ